MSREVLVGIWGYWGLGPCFLDALGTWWGEERGHRTSGFLRPFRDSSPHTKSPHPAGL